MSTRALTTAARLADRGHWEAACEVLGSAEATSDDPRVILQHAAILLSAGEAEEALTLLDGLQQRVPDYTPGLLYAGIAALDCGDAARAATSLGRARELDARNEVVGSYWALTHYTLGHDETAREYFARKGFSDNRGFLVRLTEWVESEWLTRGRFFAPSSVMGRPAGEQPVRQRGSRRRAQRAFRKKRYADVIEALTPIIERGSADAGDIYGCAVSCEMLFAYDDALNLTERLSEEDRELDAVRALRGRCLVRLGRYAEAMDCLEHVLIIGPEDFGLNYYLGLLCLAHQERRRAREFFGRAYRDYLVDTLDYQFWQIQRCLLATEGMQQR
jgi:tetratricopeptide (TPR) repeat protein